MTKDNLKISVILPVYNGEKFLKRAVNSVINQTYKNWQLVIVNDGSVDASLRIAESFAKKEKRIIVINTPNRGVSAARNTGIEAADGDLLMFLDADDWFLERAFEIVIQEWDASAQMLLFDYYDVPENQTPKYKKHFPKDKIHFGIEKEYPMKTLQLTISGFYKQNKKTVIQAPWGRAFCANYVKKKKIQFPEGIFICEDQIFNLRAVDEMTHVCYCSKPIYCYHMNLESITFVSYYKNGEKLLQNVAMKNQCVKEIILGKEDEKFYEAVYADYVFDGVKMILWWLAEECDKTKKKQGRECCFAYVKEIKKGSCQNDTFSDKILLNLCERKWFWLIEIIVSIRKKGKQMFNIR